MSAKRPWFPPVVLEPLEPRLFLSATDGSAPAAPASQTVSADAYLDKLRGMWLGEILGNYAGRPYEGQQARGGLTSPINWSGILATHPFTGDDDTCFEYMYMRLLATNPQPTDAQIRQVWVDHVPLPGFYIANRQARWRQAEGLSGPESGSIHRNMHWYAIDSQITTESLGAAAPGMRQRAADLAHQFGSVTNDGFALHAAEFYAAMYSAAAFESDVEVLVAKGLEVVPTSSYTYTIIQDVRNWYAADKAAGKLSDPDAWRDTQRKIYDKYYTAAANQGRYRYWIESAINTAMTTTSVLYGQGDFVRTIEIGVQGGFDCDCNPATAGGLIGMIHGFSNLPSDVIGATDNYVIDTTVPSAKLLNMPAPGTISQVAAGFQVAAEQQIILAGGSITGEGSERVYTLPEDVVVTPAPQVRPTGPSGLVGDILRAGGQVTVAGSRNLHNHGNDRQNLDQIIDGVTDLTQSGEMPFSTDDGDNAQPSGGDYYQINFDRRVLLNKVVFYEGDIVWGNINSDPATVTPRGGYFTDLRVEVGNAGVFRMAANLHFSEPLAPNTYYQRIEMTFDATPGDAVRIIGTAGGTAQFTTIVELEAYGQTQALPGDANGDGQVTDADYTLWADAYGSTAGWAQGDFNEDGHITDADYTLWADNYGRAIPVAAASPPPSPIEAGQTVAGTSEHAAAFAVGAFTSDVAILDGYSTTDASLSEQTVWSAPKTASSPLAAPPPMVFASATDAAIGSGADLDATVDLLSLPSLAVL